MQVATLLVALAAVSSPAAASIRGHHEVGLGDTGNQIVGGACSVDWEATKDSKGYKSDTHCAAKPAGTDYPTTDSGFACDYGDGNSAVQGSIMDLFGPVTDWPNDCLAGSTHWPTPSLGAHREINPYIASIVFPDCSCTTQSTNLNAECELITSACFMFASTEDETNKLPSYKGYAFPTDLVPCLGEYPQFCGLSCADTANGNAHWYDPVKAVTAAVTTLLSVARPDLAPACMNAALEAKAHPERHQNESDAFHAIVEKLTSDEFKATA